MEERSLENLKKISKAICLTGPKATESLVEMEEKQLTA
jgi:hypothetical protein